MQRHELNSSLGHSFDPLRTANVEGWGFFI